MDYRNAQAGRDLVFVNGQRINRAPAWYPNQLGPASSKSAQYIYADSTRSRKSSNACLYVAFLCILCAALIVASFLLAFFLHRKSNAGNGNGNNTASTLPGGSTMGGSVPTGSTMGGPPPTGSAMSGQSTVSGSFTTTPSGCGLNTFRCDSGQCLPASLKCDGNSDCGDGSDEAERAGCPCDTTTHFRCTESQECIDANFTCDGFEDCRDKSDEKNCALNTGSTVSLASGASRAPTTPSSVACTGASNFLCANGQKCISTSWKCDGVNDCADASDELRCGTCNATTQISCNDTGRCLVKEWRCDGNQDCADNSDELNCVCNPSTQFKCTDALGKCIPLRWVCDRQNDCPNASDELVCPAVTTPPLIVS